MRHALELIPFSDTEADFQLYVQLVSNLDVMSMITERVIPEAEARQDFQKIISNNLLHPQFGNFKIIDLQQNIFVGLAKLQLENTLST